MLHAGAQVDRYEVEAILGRGGFATVYLVRHRALDTRHALKVLHTGSAAMHARIMEEGRVQATLSHPNIVAVTDVFEVEGAPALLMEYIAGPSLKDLLKHGRLPLGEATRLFREIVAGVRRAHDAGIAHRDLKPANVLIAEDALGTRQPKVADFGLAKLLHSEEGEPSDAAAPPPLTRSGVAMGTPDYMAPEQVRDASRVDHRADIFSLGVMLYELLSGHRPFQGDSAHAVMNAILVGRFQPVEERVADLPLHLRTAIARCLVVDPDQRLARVEDLEALLDGRPVTPAPAPAPWARGGPDPGGTFDSFRALRDDSTHAEMLWTEEPPEPEAAAQAPEPAPPAGPEPASAATPDPPAAGGAQDEQPTAPQRFGDFELLDELGRGGMGIVYRARQVSLDRVVALKVLPRELLTEPVARDRFFREVRTLSQCTHPHLVAVRAHGEEDGVPWLAMEYIEGGDLGRAWTVLSDWMSTGLPLVEGHLAVALSWSGPSSSARFDRRLPLAASQVPTLPPGQRDLLLHLCELFADAAEGLHQLHEHGIVHRDVKPANLLLSADGERLVVTDLGLASVTEASRALTSPDISVLGTLRYMPPEQLQRQFLEVDRRADIYALGASLVELATGTPFFDGDTEQRLVQQVLNEDPASARERDPAVPVDLDTVLQKATAKRAADRYQTAQAFADDLRAFARGDAVSVRPPGRARRVRLWARKNPVPTAMLSVGGILVAGFAVVLAGAAAALPRISGNRQKAYNRVDDRYGGFSGAGWLPEVSWLPLRDDAGDTRVRVQLRSGRPERIERVRWDGRPIDPGQEPAVILQSFAGGFASSAVLQDAEGNVLQRIISDCEALPDGGARCVRRFQDALGSPRPDTDLGVVAQLQLLDEEGWLVEHRGLGLDGQTAAAYADGSWGARIDRDALGRISGQARLGPDGEVTEDAWGCARIVVERTPDTWIEKALGIGGRSAEYGYDASGGPGPCLDGASGILHDDAPASPFPTVLTDGGRAGRRSHVDADGRAAWNRHGYSTRLRQKRSGGDPADDGSPSDAATAIDLPADGGQADRLPVTHTVLYAWLDTAGAPVAARGGGPFLRQRLHGDLLLLEEQFDASGERTLGADGWATRTTEWFDGRRVLVRTAAPGGTPVRAVDGAAARVTRYEDGRPTWVSWVDEQDHPTANRWGVTTESREWEGGRLVRLDHRDAQGDPVLHLDRGWASGRFAWDEHGRLASVQTVDARGRPVAAPGDWARWSLEYDDAGRVQARRASDGNGSATARCDGVLREELVRDDHGRITGVRFTTLSGAPATDVHGVAELRFELDSLGRRTAVHRLDAEARPTPGADGCASLRYVRGPGDALASQTCLSVTGQPVTSAQGFATVARAHDALGRLLEERWLDSRGQPTANPQGVARHVVERDGRGRVSIERWLDAADQPTAGPDGYSQREPAFDAAGRIALERVTTVTGATGAGETVGLMQERDALGRVEARRVVAEDGSNQLHPDGWHRQVIGRDDWGGATSEAWFDLDGEPVAGPDGVARIVRDLRPDGRATAVRCFDPRSRPLRCPDRLRPEQPAACSVEPGVLPALALDAGALP